MQVPLFCQGRARSGVGTCSRCAPTTPTCRRAWAPPSSQLIKCEIHEPDIVDRAQDTSRINPKIKQWQLVSEAAGTDFEHRAQENIAHKKRKQSSQKHTLPSQSCTAASKASRRLHLCVSSLTIEGRNRTLAGDNTIHREKQKQKDCDGVRVL